MAYAYGEIRELVLRYLRDRVLPDIDRRSDQRPQLGYVPGSGVVRFAADVGMALDDGDHAVIPDVFHELYLERIIVPGGGAFATRDALNWPFFTVTAHGRAALAETAYTPYDPDGYLARLRTDVPRVDPVIVRHLEEALGCLRHSFRLASAVMLGCAAEKALLLLMESYTDSLGDSRARKLRQRMESRGIKRRYDEFWASFTTGMGDLPSELSDNVEGIIGQTFNLIRETRNDAGHPTGKDVEKEALHTNLILFPTYCKRLYALLSHYADASSAASQEA